MQSSHAVLSELPANTCLATPKLEGLVGTGTVTVLILPQTVDILREETGLPSPSPRKVSRGRVEQTAGAMPLLKDSQCCFSSCWNASWLSETRISKI